MAIFQSQCAAVFLWGCIAPSSLGFALVNFGGPTGAIESRMSWNIAQMRAVSGDSAFAVGKEWQGESNEAKGNLKQLIVKSNDGSRVTIEFDGATGGARWQASGPIQKDGTLAFDKWVRVVNPQGFPAVAVTHVSGGARVNKDGTLTLQVKGRVNSDSRQNMLWSATFEKAAPK